MRDVVKQVQLSIDKLTNDMYASLYRKYPLYFSEIQHIVDYKINNEVRKYLQYIDRTMEKACDSRQKPQ